MTPAEHLAMAYPGITDGLPDGVSDWALVVAADYRPSCLSDERQNLAQAHYAAYLLEIRRSSQGRTSDPSAPSGAIVEEREGDVTVKYADPGVSSGPGTGPYAAWKSLADICSRGAIITRFGW
jgi:hypothetical protein